MSDEYCPSKKVLCEIQSNGIIRRADNLHFIARLEAESDYDDLPEVDTSLEAFAKNAEYIVKLELENERYQKWVNDLQSGMYINCVYCGHNYGPNDEVPASMADVLKEHIERCLEHPMSKLYTQLNTMVEAMRESVKRGVAHRESCLKSSTVALGYDDLSGIINNTFGPLETALNTINLDKIEGEEK
jgi:hypothetical protein